MGKIGIIIQREFNERVRKRSFIVSTLLTPLLFVGIMLAPALMMNMKSSDTKQVLVQDGSGLIAPLLESSGDMTFEQTELSLQQIKDSRAEGEHDNLYGVLIIGDDVMTNPNSVQLYTYKASTMDFESGISRQIEEIIEAEKLKEYDIENLPQILESIKTRINLTAFKIDDSGKDKESSSGMAMGVALVFAMLIYMFVFIYGAMVMQGVIEEKSSKVLEIIVSSVKPFQLMMGKIIGIATVALTQFIIWVLLIFIIGGAVMYFFMGDMASAAASGDMANMAGGMGGMDPEMMASIKYVTDPVFLFNVLGGFFVYFIGGYLLYAAMFAAIGSAVDNAADAQQLQMPVTIPLILALFVMMVAMRDPNGALAFWFSMIPFTSPIVMLARIPYGVPLWEIITSLVILYGSFIAMVWFAGKIYRVGIFMSGKKPTLKEVIKWSRYKY